VPARAVVTPIVIRVYEPIGLAFEEGAPSMPPAETALAPPCLLCHRHSHLPPAKAVWISAGGVEAIGVVCGGCAFDLTDAEIERRILERVVDKVEEPVPAAA